MGSAHESLRQIFCHRFLQQAAVTLLPYHAHTALTTPEKVKHQPHDGKEHQYQYPCHGFHRIAVVEDNDDNRSDDGTEINNVEAIVAIWLAMKFNQACSQTIKCETNVGKTQKLSPKITEINIKVPLPPTCLKTYTCYRFDADDIDDADF